MLREDLEKRRDELQMQYVQANNQARELAGAVAAFDEIIADMDTPAPPASAAKSSTKGT